MLKRIGKVGVQRYEATTFSRAHFKYTVVGRRLHRLIGNSRDVVTRLAQGLGSLTAKILI